MDRLEILVEGSRRHEGCAVLLTDNGAQQNIPVCMGGSALIGCNNYDEGCAGPHAQRTADENSAELVHIDNAGLVISVSGVVRAR